MAAPAKKSPKKKQTTPSKSTARVEMGADVLPRKSLQEAEAVAKALHSQYAGKSATWDELASVLGISAKSSPTKYLIWSAQAYGLITKDASNYSLSETGRKVVAPTFDGEDFEARIKCVLTPSLLSRFYTDYNSHPIPSEQHFQNVLDSKYQVPRERVEEAKTLLFENAEYVGILTKSANGLLQINLSKSGIATPNSTAIAEDANNAATGNRAASIDWSKVVFVITPIGDDGTEVRKHADMILKHVLVPVCTELGMEVVRADKIEKSGLITKQIFENLVHSRLCVADLSFNNPNAFYELGVRHVVKRPTIQMIRKGDRIPFDVAQGRTIIFDTSDVYTIVDRLESAKRELLEHAKNALSPESENVADDNPIQTYLPSLKVTVGSA
jgi:hypothetical protein